MAQPNSNTPKKQQNQSQSHNIDGYAIVEKIGAGSYSTVYKGFKTVTEINFNNIPILNFIVLGWIVPWFSNINSYSAVVSLNWSYFREIYLNIVGTRKEIATFILKLFWP